MKELAAIVGAAVLILTPGDAPAGKACGVSYAKNCSKCHGETGEGGEECSRSLAEVLAAEEADEGAVERAKKAHPGLKDMDEAELLAAVGFLRCSARREAVSFLANCAGCHGPGARGGESCRRDIGLDLDGVEPEDAIKRLRKVEDHADLKKLPDAEIAAAAAYLGAAATYRKKCINCHGFDAKGGKVCRRDITEGLKKRKCGEVVAVMKEVKAHGAARQLDDEELLRLVEYLKGMAE